MKKIVLLTFILLAIDVAHLEAATARPSPTPRSSRQRTARRAHAEPAPPQGYRITPAWYKLPKDLTQFSDGAESDLRFQPERRMLPSVRRRWTRIFVFTRAVSILYLASFAFFLFPVIPFGPYRLTFFEKHSRQENIEVGEKTAFALWRARRKYGAIPVQKWHPLSSLPPNARISYPLPRGHDRVSGTITERYEFWEPDTLRQFLLYIVEHPSIAEPQCLLVYPNQLGDWRKVEVQSGFVHSHFTTDNSPIPWPPANEQTILNAQGWPATYDLHACNWQRAGINPLPLEMQGIVRRASDPPGRQYQPRASAFWSYAARKRQRTSVRGRLDIFLLLDEAVMLETDFITPRAVEYELEMNGEALAPMKVKH